MRMNITEIQIRARQFPELEINLFNLVTYSGKFYNCCIFTGRGKDIFKLYEARRWFESCLTIMKDLIEPSNNELIEVHAENHFISIEEYFDNLLSITDSELTELKINNKTIRKNFVPGEVIDIHLKYIKEKLMDYMENLVIMPLLKSLTEYRDYSTKIKELPKIKVQRDGKDIERTVTKKQIFEYLLFRNMFISSRLRGSPMRQRISVSSGLGISINEKNIYKTGGRKKAPATTGQTLETPPSVKEFDDIFDIDLEEDG